MTAKRIRLNEYQHSWLSNSQPRRLAGCRAEQSKRLDLRTLDRRESGAGLRDFVLSVRRRRIKDVTATQYPLPILGRVIAKWMRELDDGRGFILVRGFPAEDYSEQDAAFAYWLVGLHMESRSRKTAKVRS